MSDQPHEYGYVYTCYDPKIRTAILKYCDERFGEGNYFFDPDPGAAKNLTQPDQPGFPNLILWKMRLAMKVHPFNVMLVINHSLCGAYADAGITFTDPEAEASYHKTDMEHAIELLAAEFLEMKIEHHYFMKPEQKFKW